MNSDVKHFSVTLPIKDWEKCGHSFEATESFCKKKLKELELRLKKADLKTNINSEINKYHACLEILKIAQNRDSIICSISCSSDKTVFTFSFMTKEKREKFSRDIESILSNLKCGIS